MKERCEFCGMLSEACKCNTLARMASPEVLPLLSRARGCYYCGRRDGGHTGLCHPEAKLKP